VQAYQRVGEMHVKETVVDPSFAGKFSFSVSKGNVNTLIDV
jgi:hypothetical protein